MCTCPLMFNLMLRLINKFQILSLFEFTCVLTPVLYSGGEASGLYWRPSKIEQKLLLNTTNFTM